jgi:hypothetical protein
MYPQASWKSLLVVNVFWPAWEWGPMGLAHLRYVSFSYGAHLTHRDNGKMMRLVTSPRYRDLWGDRFDMVKIGEQKIENDQTGWKFATSIGGIGTGERGDRVLLDDPHNVVHRRSRQFDLNRSRPAYPRRRLRRPLHPVPCSQATFRPGLGARGQA